ncbi:MAG: carboxypeptidase regulatory-like domain-containing protein, partial [Planctomycetota bacterium]
VRRSETAPALADTARELREASPSTPTASLQRPSTAATVLTGTLLDLTGATIASATAARVTFVDDHGRIASADASQNGMYSRPGLPFGRYWLTARAVGYREAEAVIELGPERPQLRVDFVMTPAIRLRVAVVTKDGRSLANDLIGSKAPVAARILVPIATEQPPAAGDSATAAVLTRNVADFEVAANPAAEQSPGTLGVLVLHGDLPVHVSLLHHEQVLQTIRVATAADPVTFVVDPASLLGNLATISAVVVDAASGLPIRSAAVQLLGGSHSGTGTSTDSRGRASLDPREPGHYVVAVSAVGFEGRLVPHDAMPGSATDLGRIALEPEVAIRGRALDDLGAPRMVEFSVGVLEDGGTEIRWLPNGDFTSLEDGTFALKGLGRRQYVLATRTRIDDARGSWAGAPLVCRPQILDARSGSAVDVEIHLAAASRLVLCTDVTTASGAHFVVTDDRGFDVADGALRGAHPRSLELPSGRYVVTQLLGSGRVATQRSVALGPEPVLVRLTH